MELALRWTIGIGAFSGIGLYGLILMVGRGIADSFRAGSTAEDLSRSALIVGIPLLLILMVAGVVRPDWRAVQHTASLLAVAGVAGSVLVMQTNLAEGASYLLFLLLWLVYYSMRVFS